MIVIDKLVFNGLEFILEQNDSNVNLNKFIDNVNQVQSKYSSSSNGVIINEERIIIKHFKVININLKVDTKWLKTTLKVPNISISNFGGNSGVRVDEIGKEIVKEILHNLKKVLEEKGVEMSKKEIKYNLRRKIKQQLGVEGDKLKNKAKYLFKNFSF